MKPSTPGIINRSYSAHFAIQVLVVDLGSGGHVRFQDLDHVGAQDLVDGVFGVLEIHQQTGAGGATLAAGRGEALGDAVVAQRTTRRTSARLCVILSFVSRIWAAL